MSYLILTGHHAHVASWIAARVESCQSLEGAVAFGAMRDGRLVGGIAFTEFRGRDIRVTVAGEGAWLTRRLLRTAFAYAFQDLRCRRISAMVKQGNLASRRLVQRLGFRREGQHPGFFEDGDILCSYGLLADECLWLKG
ncbi:Protein N-acetyltransferase, RimJ/RimL family [Aureimonas altamirensis DSM 21988]|uniref:Acyl-CoA N-acyltransferase n=2 Tax=Aureimonas altamirensis TaxID=370622 RepID=A0A0P0YWP9_9HYPH|nr:GNAT family protein [Aureimonas altamirensis]BAT25901.1 Acyl-CoA N-acyltransferase [Aureimonas altamirensis]SHI51686.1 Protein N-acetyltransferase, RimJ/RimL family [Aureimonas altamirensis DSM 21988]